MRFACRIDNGLPAFAGWMKKNRIRHRMRFQREGLS
jgi:hypothetical protein